MFVYQNVFVLFFRENRWKNCDKILLAHSQKHSLHFTDTVNKFEKTLGKTWNFKKSLANVEQR